VCEALYVNICQTVDSLYVWQVPASGSDIDLLQQALTNSGLTNGNASTSATSSVKLSEPVPTSDRLNKDVATPADVSSVEGQSTLAASQPARLNVVSTMAVHDSLTGMVRRHRVRKVMWLIAIHF